MVDSPALPPCFALPAGLVPSPERLTLAAARALPVGALVACVEFAPSAFLVGALDGVAEAPRDGGEPFEISVGFLVDGEPGGDWWPFAECAVLVPAA